jgi:surface protein
VYYYTEADKIYLNSDSSFMFSDMKSLENLDLSGWDTSSVTNMGRMFSSITINSDLM